MTKRESDTGRTWLRWLVSFLVGGAIVALMAFGRGILEVEGAARVWRILCDGCFLAAVLLGGVGLMTFVSKEGTFDILSYGLLCFRNLFKRKAGRPLDEETGEKMTFYDYKVAKRGTRSSQWYLVFVGLIYLALSLLCWYFFERAGGVPLV